MSEWVCETGFRFEERVGGDGRRGRSTKTKKGLLRARVEGEEEEAGDVEYIGQGSPQPVGVSVPPVGYCAQGNALGFMADVDRK